MKLRATKTWWWGRRHVCAVQYSTVQYILFFKVCMIRNCGEIVCCLQQDVSGVLRSDVCSCVRRKAVKTFCQLIGADRVGAALLYTSGRAIGCPGFAVVNPGAERSGSRSHAHVALPGTHCVPYRWTGAPQHAACHVTLYGPAIAFFTLPRKASCCLMVAFREISVHYSGAPEGGVGEAAGLQPPKWKFKKIKHFVGTVIPNVAFDLPFSRNRLKGKFWKINFKNLGRPTLTEEKPRRLDVVIN